MYQYTRHTQEHHTHNAILYKLIVAVYMEFSFQTEVTIFAQYIIMIVCLRTCVDETRFQANEVKSVVVVGNGNVATDVARILLMPTTMLARTHIVARSNVKPG